MKYILTILAVMILTSCSEPATDADNTLNTEKHIQAPPLGNKFTYRGIDYPVKTSYATMREITHTNEVTLGSRFVTTFLYSGKSMFSDSENCGYIIPSDIDVSFNPKDAIENYLTTLNIMALCFPDSQSYDYYSSGCNHSYVSGGTCYIKVAGYYSGRKIVKMPNAAISERNAFVITPELVETIEKDSWQGVKSGVEGALTIAEWYGNLKDVTAIIK